nr:1-deoxy-D-xylulose-5-phosphate synthase [Anaeromicrobium sediminis]
MQNFLDKVNTPNVCKASNYNELEVLAGEIRKYLIDKVSITGGHLASNLGVVELTLALHNVFDTSKDKIVWDVGHQTYVHKILTGRANEFDTLRQYKGLSGFPKRSESIHDHFDTGHSSTSISAALGMAKARDIKEEDYSVVAVIGDGALTGGMAFEALNHAGHSNTELIVILNDNEMSISPNVGGMSKYLNRLRTDPKYVKVKDEIEQLLNKIPAVGKTMAKTVGKAKDSLKHLLVPGVLFGELGFTYLGPVDGHDIKELKIVLERAKKIKGPVLVHTITKKGKGYSFAEKNPDKYHGISPFDVKSGKTLKKSTKGEESYSSVFGKALVNIGQKNKNVVAITAAMPTGTGLLDFSIKYPERFFDVGIAEQHAVTFAAGLAACGLTPVFAVYSTFLQRAYDQIIHDVCLQNLPVVFCLDRSGIVGNDGETHHGVFDLSFLTSVPNLTVMAPKDGKELENMLEYAVSLNKPVAIRYPRGTSQDFTSISNNYNISSGKSEVLTDGQDVCIIAIGKMVKVAYDAAIKLLDDNINCKVINARFAKPLDKDTLIKECKGIKNVLIIEDNLIKGGFGNKVLELFNEENIKCDLKLLGFPDEFIEHGDTEILMKAYKLDSNSIVQYIKGVL